MDQDNVLGLSLALDKNFTSLCHGVQFIYKFTFVVIMYFGFTFAYTVRYRAPFPIIYLL
jgi:hypothetical protein